ncbi:MAG: UbiA family prenyltransferase [Methanotrichaceae archaeon]
MTPNVQICSAMFLITFSIYSLNKLTDLEEDAINMPERLSFLSDRRNIILFSALGAYLLSIMLIFVENLLAVPIVFVPLITNAVYSSKLLPGIPRLKDIPVMKNVTVSVSWALVCVLLPAVQMTNASKMEIALVLYFMLIKVFINTVLYDIRDVKGDRETSVRTMPVLLGTKKTTAILLVLNSALLPLLAFADGEIRLLMSALIVYGYIYIIYFRERRNPLHLDFFVDGEWTLASVLLLLIFNF